jgi:glutaredoxin
MWSWLFGRGQRTPHEVILYTRQGCHLCEDALGLLQRAAQRYLLHLREVDIDTQPALVAEHGEHVPVVVIDGRVRFRGTVNPVLLDRLLRSRQ